jgi:hypothetical protein
VPVYTIRATLHGKIRSVLADTRTQAEIIAATWFREGCRHITIDGKAWGPDPKE